MNNEKFLLNLHSKIEKLYQESKKNLENFSKKQSFGKKKLKKQIK